MIVPVALRLVIAPARVAVVIIAMIIPMLVGLHDMMIVRAALVRAILRADQCRSQCGHRDSGQGKYRGFPKMLAHVAFLVQC